MTKLKSLIPDAEVLIAMHPADLAGYVLEVLLSQPPHEKSLWHRRNFCGAAATDYVADVRHSGPDRRVAESCAVAWSWLESQWLICKDPEQDADWYIATRRGRELRDRAGVRALIEAETLPESFLHPLLIADVRALFLQGRYDLAVFKAFHQLEVAIRDTAGLGLEVFGAKLVTRAFNPDGGVLTDRSAEASEQQSLMNLMAGAIGSYKNPQSHRHVGLEATEAREMIMLASHPLKIVESRASQGSEPT